MNQQAAFWRLLLMCLAAAAGQTAAIAMGAPELRTAVGILLGAAVYVLTQDTSGPPGRKRGEIRYWRGRRVDDGDDKSRWN